MRLTFTASAALALLAGAPALAAADPPRFMTAELIAETAVPKVGTTILVGFQMTPRPGWHGYWSNPGDSGIAPSVIWSAPKGVSFGPLLHPAPTLLSADGINSYVHDGPHVLLSRMTVDRSVSTGVPIPIEAKLSWAACTATQCVPLHARFKLQLVTGDGAASPDSALLAAAVARLPRMAPEGSFVAKDNARRLLLPASIRINPATTRFFPDDNDAFVTATGRTALRKGAVVITGIARAARSPISGVIADGHSSYRISFSRLVGAPEPIARETIKSDVRPSLPTATEPPPHALEIQSQPTNKPAGNKADWLPMALAGVLILGGGFTGLLFAKRR